MGEVVKRQEHKQRMARRETDSYEPKKPTKIDRVRIKARLPKKTEKKDPDEKAPNFRPYATLTFKAIKTDEDKKIAIFKPEIQVHSKKYKKSQYFWAVKGVSKAITEAWKLNMHPPLNGLDIKIVGRMKGSRSAFRSPFMLVSKHERDRINNMVHEFGHVIYNEPYKKSTPFEEGAAALFEALSNVKKKTRNKVKKIISNMLNQYGTDENRERFIRLRKYLEREQDQTKIRKRLNRLSSSRGPIDIHDRGVLLASTFVLADGNPEKVARAMLLHTEKRDQKKFIYRISGKIANWELEKIPL